MLNKRFPIFFSWLDDSASISSSYIHSCQVRQLESSLLPPKHQKHLNPSGTMKPTEQEKLNLKRECEQFQKERSPTIRKVSFESVRLGSD
jgi:hypothetical protein